MKVDQIEERESFSNEGGGKKLYQGLAKLTPVAVNPTKEQLEKILGTELDRDINYENGDKYRLDFWCKELTVDRLIKFSIFISNADVKSKSGNNQYINAYGKTGYFESMDAITEKNNSATEEWQKMKPEGLRVAKTGEATLYDFLIKLFNASDTKPFPMFESYQKLTLGNLRELKEVIDNAIEKERVFHMLVGVKDGKYQDAWTNMFLPALFTAKSEQYFYKKASDPNYPFKSDWGLDLKFREYLPSPAPAGGKIEEEASASQKDDLPW